MTSAIRSDVSDTIRANYTYTYDSGDNLVTKTEPWSDDFTDGGIAAGDWSTSGTWSASTLAAKNTAASTAASMYKTVNDDDVELRYTYSFDSYTASVPTFSANFRYNTTSGERLIVQFRPDRAVLGYYNGSAWTTWSNTSVTSSTGSKYKVRIEAEGDAVKVWRSPGSGGTETQIFNQSSMPQYNGNRVDFLVAADTSVSVDDIVVFADDLSRQTTFGVNNANEMTAMTDYNGAFSFGYDELGRMITKSRGGYSADYAWHLDDRLTQVDSDFPGEGLVDYNYGGDGNRRTRTQNSATTTYNWDAGYNVLSEENGSGALTRSYVGRSMAHIDGATPSSGTFAYYSHDHLLSTRGLYDGTKALTGDYEFTPYGDPYQFTAASGATTHLFTGHDLDPMTGMYFAPYRYLASGAGRWASRDPLGVEEGPNTYLYVAGNPSNLYDETGLSFLDRWGNCVGRWTGQGAVPGAIGAAGGGSMGAAGRDNWPVHKAAEKAMRGMPNRGDPWINPFSKRRIFSNWGNFKRLLGEKLPPAGGRFVSPGLNAAGRAGTAGVLAAGLYSWGAVIGCGVSSAID